MHSRNGESFFKKYELLLLLILYGCIFMTAGDRWKLYVEPVRDKITQVRVFFGWEKPQEVVETQEPVTGFQRMAFCDGKTPEMLGIYWDDLDDEVYEDDPENGPLEPGNEDAWYEEQWAKMQNAEEPELPETGIVQLNDDGSVEPKDSWNAADFGITYSPVWGTVEADYFDDALFLGDSRVVGLRDYDKLDHGTFYAEEGMSIYKLLTKKIVSVPDQSSKISVEEVLEQNHYAKIYLMVGINELDVGTTERFQQTYRETINRIRELQPEAKIIIQSIMLVSKKRSAKGDFVNNDKIRERNDAIKQLADDETVFYLDVNEAVVDEEGCLNTQYTGDGIHLKAQYVPVWTEYLKTHALVW